MKTINFKRSDSAIRVWDDDPRAKKNINWDRIIYLLLLVIVVFFGGRYLVGRFLYVNATGHILFEKRNIRNVDDCQILRFYVEEGDSVKAGDTLFTYIEDDDNARGGGGGAIGSAAPVTLSVSQGGPGNDDWKIKEIYNLKKTISSNRIRIAENEKLQELYQAQKKRLKEQVILDLAPRSKLDDVEESIKQTVYEIERLRSESGAAAAFINNLMGMESPQGNKSLAKLQTGGRSYASNGSGGDDNGLTRYYLSPIDGTVTKINFESMEVALKSEIIISIHKPENIYIKGFFDQGDMDDISIGDVVHVEFPDGTKSRGRIQRFYYATNAIPEEFQKKYEPVTRTLLADIVPVNDIELKKWRAFYRMGVKIYKYKY